MEERERLLEQRLVILETTMGHIQTGLESVRTEASRHVHRLSEETRKQENHLRVIEDRYDVRLREMERSQDQRFRTLEKHQWMSIGALAAIQAALHFLK